MGLFPKWTWKGHRRLTFYESYDSWEKALKTAKYYKKKLNNNYYIMKIETFWAGKKVYGLYMNKIYSLV